MTIAYVEKLIEGHNKAVVVWAAAAAELTKRPADVLVVLCHVFSLPLEF